MIMYMKYTAVCFDIDGTLYPESEEIELMSNFIRKHPVLNLKYRKLRNNFRILQERESKIFSSGYSFREKEAYSLLGENANLNKIQKFINTLENKYYLNLKIIFSRLKPETAPIKTLKYLKDKNIIIGALSDWPLYDKLNKLGLSEYFDFSMSSEETGYLKPSIKCFNYMLNKYNLSADKVLFVGDSYNKDICGAYDAGMDAALINYKEESNFNKAFKKFKNFHEFENWITNL